MSLGKTIDADGIDDMDRQVRQPVIYDRAFDFRKIGKILRGI